MQEWNTKKGKAFFNACEHFWTYIWKDGRVGGTVLKAFSKIIPSEKAADGCQSPGNFFSRSFWPILKCGRTLGYPGDQAAEWWRGGMCLTRPVGHRKPGRSAESDGAAAHLERNLWPSSQTERMPWQRSATVIKQVIHLCICDNRALLKSTVTMNIQKNIL